MKKLLLSLLLTSLFSFSSSAQDYWKTYRQAQGVIDSVIIDIALSGDKVFIATPRGLSVFENDSFVNYDTTNSSLMSQNIKELEVFGDTLYMATDSGLSQFVDGTITNYTVADGLINDTIEDLEVTSTGELWIATLRGISRKRGDSFLNDPTRKVYHLGINGGDSVYAIVNFSTIVFAPGFTFTEMYDGAAWRRVEDPNITIPLTINKLVSLEDGSVVVLARNDGIYQINDEFTLEKLNIPDQDADSRFLVDVSLANNGYWVAHGTPNFQQFGDQDVGLINWTDSSYDFHSLGLPDGNVLAVATNDQKIYLGTKDGFAVADISIEVFPFKETIENSSLRATFGADGILFDSRDLPFNEGLEFPKNSRRSVTYTSNLWLYAVDQLNSEKLATQYYDAGDYGLGSVSNNSTPFRPNILKITSQEIRDHLQNYNDPNYEMPRSILKWPANGYVERGEAADQAPFVDANNNGCYDPENGDYPWILGDEAVYIIINDDVNPSTGLFTDNIGAEVHIMAYVFDRPQIPHIDQSVFVRYTIINRSRYTYRLRAGMFWDPDLGGPGDDFSGVEPSTNSTFAYNADNFDDDFNSLGRPLQGYDSIIPAVGFQLINANIQHFATLPVGNIVPSPLRRPIVQQHYFNRFNGLWNDLQPFTLGGIGYDPSSSNVVDYIYSGDPRDPNEWAMINIDPSFGYVGGSDASSLTTFDEIQFRPRDRQIYDLVFSIGYDSSMVNDNLGPIGLLKSNLNKAASFQRGLESIALPITYSNCFVGLEEQAKASAPSDPLLVYPNPSNGLFTLESMIDLNTIEVFNLQGQLIQQIRADQSQRKVSIELPSSAKEGLYLIRAIGEDGKAYSKRILFMP